MKHLWALAGFLCVIISYLPEVQAAPLKDTELVRVRVSSFQNKVRLSGTGLRFQNLANPYRAVAIPQNSGVEVRLLEQNGKKMWALRLSNSEQEHLFPQKYLLIQGQDIQIGAQSLPSRVMLSAPTTKTIDVIGVLPLNDYLVGVLSSEMPLTWPMETLKAQAVAARSYTLALLNERQNKAYHVESSILDQVFKHVDGEDDDAKTRRAREAVAATDGVKLFDNHQKVLKAFYHADCGGKTALAKDVWNSGPNMGVATDSSCPTNPKARWTFAIDKAELQSRLHLQGLLDLTLKRITNDTRVKDVRLAMNESQQKVMSVNDFRQNLGFQNIRSSIFDVKEENGKYVFQGKGYGHGVGLCQWGSRALGMRGMNYAQILKHYYPLASLN